MNATRTPQHSYGTTAGPGSCLLAALGPIVLLLTYNGIVWGDGPDSYQFWRIVRETHANLTDCATLVTDWGNPLAYLIYGLILVRAVLKKNRDDLRFVLCYIAVQLVIALVLTNVLKNAFGMPRPYVEATQASPWSFKSMYQSFPSGHTTEIVGAVLPLALRWCRLPQAALCGLWIAAVAYSRIYLGRHHLIDIWGGIALGGFAAFCILYLAGKLSMNDTPQKDPDTGAPDSTASGPNASGADISGQDTTPGSRPNESAAIPMPVASADAPFQTGTLHAPEGQSQENRPYEVPLEEFAAETPSFADEAGPGGGPREAAIPPSGHRPVRPRSSRPYEAGPATSGPATSGPAASQPIPAEPAQPGSDLPGSAPGSAPGPENGSAVPQSLGDKILSGLAYAGLLVALLLAVAQVCLGLDARSLWFSDEVRHGAVYEAMRQSGNWLILTLNGDLYPDKPPLYFWFLYLLDRIPQLDPPRLFLAANALCGVLFTGSGWLLARGLGYDKKTSLASSLVLLSTFSFLGITHYARMDLLFATCIVLSQLCLYRGWVKESAPIWMLLGFALAAAACLIKGPLGLAFPLLSSLLFLIWRATFRRAGNRDGAFGFGIMLIILLAWVTLVLLQNGGKDYLTSMFGKHMIDRALDAWHHKQAWWFYFANLPLAWLPWTLVVFFLPWERLPRLLKAAGAARREAPGHAWPWIALISGMGVLSTLSGKVGIYTLPLYPFLAILTAQGILALTPRRSRAFFLLLSLLLLLLAALFGLAGAYPHIRDMLPPDIAPENLLDMSKPGLATALAYVLTLKGLPILAGVCFVFFLLLLRGTNRARPAGPLLMFALFVTVLAQPLAMITAPSLDTLMSPRPQADILRTYQDKGYHVTAFYVTSGTYSYYMGGRMDEINDWADLRARLDAHPKIIVATRLARWKEWQQKAELQPEAFRMLNTQWIAEREYAVLVRDTPASAPAPAAAPAPASTPAPVPQPTPAVPPAAPDPAPALPVQPESPKPADAAPTPEQPSQPVPETAPEAKVF